MQFYWTGVACCQCVYFASENIHGKRSGLGLPISSCVYIILAQVHVYMMPINQTLLNVIKVEIYMKLQ